MRWLAPVVLILAAVSSLLSVNTFPVVGQDSLVYIDHSRQLGEMGWIHFGHRQVGYPLFLAAIRQIADWAGAEPLLTVVVAQRTLLIGAGVLAFWFWRWAALPLLIYLMAPATTAYTNFVLIEGLSFPVALLLVFPTYLFIREVRRDQVPRSAVMTIRAGLVVAGALFLLAMKFIFAVFGLVPLALVFAAWNTKHRRIALASFGVYAAVALAMIAAFSFENRSEYGVLEPSVAGEYTAYYYAWAHTFGRQPENRTDPVLQQYFDDGNLLHFSREMDASGLEYREQRPLYDNEIESMLAAAGNPRPMAQVESTLWALVGGRLDDIEAAMKPVLASSRHNIDEAMMPNRFAAGRGIEAFAERYNDSQVPEAVITDPLGKRLQILSSRILLNFFLPSALILVAAGLRNPRTRLLAAIGGLVVVSAAAGLGYLLADNYRLLISTSVFGLGTATAIFSSLIHDRNMAGHGVLSV